MTIDDTSDEWLRGRLYHAQATVPAAAPSALAAARKLNAVTMTNVRSGRQFVTGAFDDQPAEGLDDSHHLRRVGQRIASIGEPPDFAQVLEAPQKAP